MFRTGKSIETEGRLVVVIGLGEKGMGASAIGYGFLFGETKLWSWVVVVAAQLGEYTNNHCITFFKKVNIMLYELYHNYLVYVSWKSFVSHVIDNAFKYRFNRNSYFY